MKEITYQEFLDLFDVSVHNKLFELAQSKDTDGFVVFENLDFCSSNFGQRTAVVYGKTRTYKTPDETISKHLNDLPNQRQYPISFCKTDYKLFIK